MCAAAFGVVACGPVRGGEDPGDQGGGLGGIGDTTGEGGQASTAGQPGTTGMVTTDDGPSVDDGETEPLPPSMSCNYPSTSFGQGMQELDIEPGGTDVLSFTVTGVGDPVTFLSATLLFDSYDADHPGQEGVVFVNGQGLFDLPADAGWDNLPGNGSIDVSGTLVEGINVVEFGGGTFEEGTFYRIGDVRLEVEALTDQCEAPPRPPPKNAVPREVDFWDATYSMRHNWVLRCDGFEYAYTAASDEHIDSDCDGLYAPDGSRRGTATFTFADLVPASYEIQIHSRHTVNRNPQGALFVVDGEGIRIDQRDDANFTTDIWGVRDLGGMVTVVLDSSQESESDSVVWVRLEPVGG